MIRVCSFRACDLTEELFNAIKAHKGVTNDTKKQIDGLVWSLSNTALAISSNEWINVNQEVLSNKYRDKIIEFYYDDCGDSNILPKTNT